MQGIGNEVLTHAGTVMKDQVAQVICDAIVDLRDQATEVAERMQRNMGEAFRATLNAELSGVHASLQGVGRAIEGQGQSNLERLLDQLGNVVSGGFRSQSEDMGRQLEQVALVLPQLQAQFSQMSQAMETNARSWGEQNSGAVHALSEQVNQLVSRFDGVATRIGEASQSMMAAAEKASTHIFDSAKVNAIEVDQKIRQMTRSAGEETHAISLHVASLSQSLEKSHSALATINKNLTESAGAFERVLQSVRDATVTASASARTFEGAAQALSAGSTQLGRTLTAHQQTIQQEEKLISAQREATEALQPVIRELLETYERSVKTQATVLSETWKKLAQDLQKVLEGAGASLSDSVDELQGSVSELRVSLQNGRTRA